MRLLANENIPGDAVAALRAVGHDVAWVRSDTPGSTDLDVLARAMRENRVLLTSTRTSANWPGAGACPSRAA